MSGVNIHMVRARRMAHALIDETIPTHLYTIIRLSVGLIYFWFGVLKLPALPGPSPAYGLVSTWGGVIDPDTFMLVLAVFETLMGLLLLLNRLTQPVALLLALHVCGTFLTVFVGAEQVFNLEHGLYSLTLHGQYIVKNVLLLAACLALGLTTPRRHKRLPLKLAGSVKLQGKVHRFVTQDVSYAGLSFLIRLQDNVTLLPNDRLDLVLLLPIVQNTLELPGRVVHLTRREHWPESLYVIGCEFLETTPSRPMLQPYLAHDPDLAIETFTAALPPCDGTGAPIHAAEPPETATARIS